MELKSDNIDVQMVCPGPVVSNISFNAFLSKLDEVCDLLLYRTREIFGRGKIWWIWQIVSYSSKFSSPIFTDTPKMYLAYALSVAY